MRQNILIDLFDGLRESFKGMDNADLDKETRVAHFHDAQEYVNKIDNAIRFAKGQDTRQFNFSSITQMLDQPPLTEGQERGFQNQFADIIVEIFANLDDEMIEQIFAGQFEDIPKPEKKGGMPALVEGQDVVDAEEEDADLPADEKALKRTEEKIKKIFPRMGSDNQSEADTAYRQTFAMMQKLNKSQQDAGNKDYQISFSGILAASQCDARVAADMKGIKIDAHEQDADVQTSNSTGLRVVPQKKRGAAVYQESQPKSLKPPKCLLLCQQGGKGAPML